MEMAERCCNSRVEFRRSENICLKSLQDLAFQRNKLIVWNLTMCIGERLPGGYDKDRSIECKMIKHGRLLCNKTRITQQAFQNEKEYFLEEYRTSFRQLLL
ncbi:hypothetical protein WUBG_07343 [Wuchereria bancrofti]|uniref:Uncharacterized protein n=1 Tax=Wuchereria bancrofti TaxID=6293 RepID=J9EHV2_WUCBA|nr:hypothetical protein WUBG_07343 [Wuchereria bancrofti]VDM20413.1 unnamed protein product [Wuchereria bancrofti]